MSNFFTNVFKLVSGSVIAQVVGVLLIPIITRIYGPEDFGVLQLFISISGIIAILSCLSYQLSIMLPEKDEDSANIVIFCVVLIIISSIISGVISIFFADNIGQILHTPQISNYLILLPVVVFLNGLFFVMNYWLSRKLRFGVLAYSSVFSAVISKLVQLGSSFASTSPLGLIFGLIGGYAVADFWMLRGMKKDGSFLKEISVKRMKELAIRYKEFPLYSSWSTVANSVSTQVPSFMLAFFYSPTVVGHYSLANTAVNLPMAVVGSAIGQVFFQKASEQKIQTGSVKNIVSEVHKKLVSIGIFPMLLLMVLSEEIFSFVFGVKWGIAGTYAKILIPWLFLVFISSPLSTLFSVLEKQRVGFAFDLMLLISRILALYIGGHYGGPFFALILFSATGVVFWGWMNFYLLKISNVSHVESFYVCSKYPLLSLVMLLPVIFLKYFLFPSYLLFTVAGISALFYYLIIIYEDVSLRNEIYSAIKG